jgi:hypothetical protein
MRGENRWLLIKTISDFRTQILQSFSKLTATAKPKETKYDHTDYDY